MCYSAFALLTITCTIRAVVHIAELRIFCAYHVQKGERIVASVLHVNRCEINAVVLIVDSVCLMCRPLYGIRDARWQDITRRLCWYERDNQLHKITTIKVRNSPLKRSGVNHTAFTLQTHHTCFTRSLSPEGATAAVYSNSSNLITAYYSFIDPERMKGWVGLVGWPTADGLPL